jgi:hypothetical protein
MTLIESLKDYIRGFDLQVKTDLPRGYSIQPIQTESGINRDLSTIIIFLFLAIFWLGIENYLDMIQTFSRRKQS